MAQVVVVEHADLRAGKDLSKEVLQAFGPDGIGLCAIRGVPGFPERRAALLPLARELAKLPKETLQKYEFENTSYCLGWSHGREKFKGIPDIAKGSFYANPIFDDPAEGNEEVRKAYPFAASKNVWPEEVPALEAAFKAMGQLIYDTAQPLLQQCDALVAKTHPEHTSELFDTTFTNSKLALGRLLHYFPGESESWCGWHNDNSTITGLVPAMFLDDGTAEEATLPPSTDAGLYVQARDGSQVPVKVPNDCLAFQIGEAAQILSGGILQATPHFVKGHVSKSGEQQISRESFAIFIEPQWDAMIGPPKSAKTEDVLARDRAEIEQLIPPLAKRWKPAEDGRVSFGKYLGDSFVEYYAHNNN